MYYFAYGVKIHSRPPHYFPTFFFPVHLFKSMLVSTVAGTLLHNPLHLTSTHCDRYVATVHAAVEIRITKGFTRIWTHYYIIFGYACVKNSSLVTKWVAEGFKDLHSFTALNFEANPHREACLYKNPRNNERDFQISPILGTKYHDLISIVGFLWHHPYAHQG